MNGRDIETLQIDLDKLGEWAVLNAMQIHPGKSKAVSFMGAGVKDLLNYFWGGWGGPKNSGREQL
jgi:hypothetical protein